MTKRYLKRNLFLLSIGALSSFALNAQCPTISCPSNITSNNDAGNCGAVVNYTAPVGTNPCATTTQTFSYTGAIVNWTVPAGVTSVHIVASGAQGGFNTNSTTQSGLGATMEGDFAVTPGAQLKILVGEQPSATAGNGGGGGTFVTDFSNSPLVIAGGGGGSSQGADSPAKHGNVTTTGGTGAAGGGVGGTNGSGGSIGSSGFQSGAGGGLLTNGADGWTGGTGGFSFLNGGSGGPTNAPARGGFGGGGSGSSYVVGGGGGGYSGGGSGGNSTAGVGGGGSFNAGTNQVNTGGNHTGNGVVTITYSSSATTTTALIAGLGSGGTFPIGTTTETYEVNDGLGNSTTCSFTITVNDNELPTISAPSTIISANDAGMCGAVITFTAPVGTDNCAGATTVQTAGLPSGSNFPVGTTTNTYTVTDAAGNTASASFTVTVNDTEAPVMSCTSNIAVNNDANMCSAVVTYNAPTATDNCSVTTTVQTAGLGSGATFPIGITTETYTTTDAAGNTSTCSFTVSVSDAEAPVISCPSNMTVNNDAGQCSAVVTYNAPAGTDNCSAATTTLVSGIGSGGTFPAGTTVETYEVTDGAGNSTTCQFSITVADNEAPTFNCPSDVTSCTPVIAGIGVVNAADNCASTLGITYMFTGATTGSGTGDASGSTFNPGVTAVWYVVNDGNGNSDTCSFTVTINTATPPTVSASDNTVCLSDAQVTLTGTPAGGTWSGTGVSGTSFNPAAAGVGSFAPAYTYIDQNGCEGNASVTIAVNACVGVNENAALAGVSIYPNPNNGTFSIAVNANAGDLIIEIMDMQGRVVYTSVEKNVQAGFVKQLSPEAMSTGMYMLKISGNGQQRIEKISVQK